MYKWHSSTSRLKNILKQIVWCPKLLIFTPYLLIFKKNSQKLFLPLNLGRDACSVVSNFLQPHGLQPTQLLNPWNFPGKNTRVGCHFLLQGIFLTRGSNSYLLSLLHWQVEFYHWCHLGNLVRTDDIKLLSEHCHQDDPKV